MAKYTEGPWERGYTSQVYKDGKVIAQFFPLNGTREQLYEVFANAQLASAGPELFEALEWLVHIAHDVGKGGGRPEAGEFEAAVKEGEEALEKARRIR